MYRSSLHCGVFIKLLINYYNVTFDLQLSCYDQFKQILLMLPIFKDNIITHFTASFMAVSNSFVSYNFPVINLSQL